ncbi:rod shape-determining protein MreC [Niallia sp. NCCP-28]|uniref:rod shape-determining protein MreC n=1 Tax=Niallia sp. NCCP-28 TaxID=2934712 RepID=UPI002086CBE8|nr:rod shape-determining protein MreC [Niallia sp. NCCP-28]GKU81435.1 cell shape-determining protein MreC [Niallia sp. NCCP-28]
MPQFFMNKRLIILLVSIIILVALIGFSIRSRDKLTWPEQFIKDTSGWVQTLVSRPAHYVAGFIDNVRDLQSTYEENKELKSKLEELGKLEYQVQGLQKENATLHETLEEKENLSSYNPMNATVIRRNPDRWRELLTINKGSSNGVKKNMAVMTASGLIGKVKSVSTGTATVQLLSSEDPTNRISAVIQEDSKKKGDKVFGLIVDYDKESKYLIMESTEDSKKAKIKKGQLVTTSGLGGVFPEGLPVGKVVKVEPDKDGLTNNIFIQPAADFYDIEHVIIIKRTATQPDDIEEEKGL